MFPSSNVFTLFVIGYVLLIMINFNTYISFFEFSLKSMIGIEHNIKVTTQIRNEVISGWLNLGTPYLALLIFTFL